MELGRGEKDFLIKLLSCEGTTISDLFRSGFKSWTSLSTTAKFLKLKGLVREEKAGVKKQLFLTEQGKRVATILLQEKEQNEVKV